MILVGGSLMYGLRETEKPYDGRVPIKTA